MAPTANYYDLLGLTKDASPEEIRRAYHDAALIVHPDVNKEREATERFIQLQRAYEVLSDPLARQTYDREMAEHENDPVLANILYSATSLATVDEPQLMYALLNFSPGKRFKDVLNPPLNLCLVLDRSTSMQGLRMDTVKEAAIEMVRSLRPQDQLSIVVFSDRAEVLLPAGRNVERKIIETQIQMTQAGGGTEIFQGLEAGYLEVRRTASRALINHIILVTDGRTYGDEEQCLQLAITAASQGIRITGVGIGTEWNDVFLDHLASLTGGTSFFISRTSDISDFLREKFTQLKQTFADRVSLKLGLAPGVNLSTVFRVFPEPAPLPNELPIWLGSIPQESGMSILLEFKIGVLKQPDGRFKLASGELEFVLPRESAQTAQLPITLSRMVSDEISTELPSRPIFQALAQLNLYRMQERARQEVADGKVQEASVRLQRLATELLNLGEIELAHTTIMEAERIQQTRMLSAEGEKRIKYGTRSLLLEGSLWSAHKS
jgi:Ca-activated chloride channel family protein